MPQSIDSLLTTGTVPLSLLGQLSKLDEYRGREALFRSQQGEALDRLVDVARIQSTEAPLADWTRSFFDPKLSILRLGGRVHRRGISMRRSSGDHPPNDQQQS